MKARIFQARFPRRVSWLAVFSLFSLCACEFVAGYRGFRPRTDAGASQTGIEGCERLNYPSSVRGAALRHAHNGKNCFWIDETEVTESEYQQFLALGSPQLPMPPPCFEKTAFSPGLVDETGKKCQAGEWRAAEQRGDYPVVCVDWCDAQAYCRFAGKSLCRDSFQAPALLDRSDWYAACANGTKETPYPYPEDYSAAACNGSDHLGGACDAESSCGPRAVNGLPSCTNDEGVSDLSGNVAEWTDSCDDSDSRTYCKVRGGSFRETSEGLQCGSARSYRYNVRDPAIGFRCCKDP